MGGSKSLPVQNRCPAPGEQLAASRVKTGIFLQVRLDSRRLPRKALLPLPGGNVIQHAMRALKLIKADIHALLTDGQSANELSDLAEVEGFALFTGPSADVLERFCRAIGHFKVTRVIRATGDNPLVSAGLAQNLLSVHGAEGLDLSHFSGLPVGTGVEVVEAKVLIESSARTDDPYEHEHITTYAYRHPDDFRIGRIPCPETCYLPPARVTLDTEADYQLISRIFAELFRKKPLETEEIVLWFKENHILNIPSSQRA
ncbi:hypothetical protein ES703_32077 [subsurface metagenome]